ncbi:hypothetical protein [Paenibacillus sp. DMB20]|uniref:hypothetical protein n=1 Tax=Paenibacillus sp. DMB20 TaxID=1642570 RepID=UPI0006280858|nr:hypothetical protein [Paenibacillus sp. DMB20]KKO55264.1 hypothetical protein XI25_02000 [Paenibacillus sp. DMB20]
MTPEHQPALNPKKPRKRVTPKRHPGLLRKKRKLPALLLAAVFPGMGHVYLGLYRKGTMFIMMMMLDVSALLYFSSIGMQINVPLLILLGLTIPVGYFYNVYDVLQSADFILSKRRRSEAAPASADAGKAGARFKNPFRAEGGLSFGLMMVAGGAMLILLHQKPPWLQTGIRDYGAGIIAVFLMLAGICLGLNEATRNKK